MTETPTPRAIALFWSHVAKGEASACWLWTASVGSHGYGNSYDGKRVVCAHRLSFVIHNGPVPDGMFVLHSCDNKRCVNPAHLRAGTHRENMDDASQRDRALKKLTKTQAAAIRTAPGRQQDVARAFGVSPKTVQMIRAGRTHRHAG